MKKYILYFLPLILMSSCGISEDCFKGNGNQITQTFPLEDFTKIKVYDGVGLVVKEGSDYEVKVVTSDNIIDDLEVRLDGDMLVIKDNSTCNIARDYGQTKVYVTIPDGTVLPLISELELHCKTEQKIESEGVLHSRVIRLFSMDLSDGAGTGDFHLTVNSNEYVIIESNNVSNFYIKGQCNNLNVAFFWGNGIFYGEEIDVSNSIYVFHRGSNDMIFRPTSRIYGDIYSVGNVILKSLPLQDDIIQHYTGRVIYQIN
jgi:hypothetical protein